MKKLPAEYRSLLRKKEQQQKGGLESVSKEALVPDEVNVQFEFRGSLEPLIALGLRLTSRDGNFADGVIALDNLEALAAHPNIVRISHPPHRRKFLDKSIPDIHANELWSRSGDTWSGNTGKDIIIGIVDTGIDYQHKTFRKADNTSRILFIWDQTLDVDDDDAALGEDVPGTISTPGGDVDLDYGVEFVREDPADDERPTINKALANSDPYSIVRHKDKDGHGTHVAGIAGGDGSQSDACCGAYTYVGVAPEAEYIIVRLIGLTEGDPAAPPGSGNSKVNAIRYILNRANGRPCVINLSLGSDLGARDGSGIEEQRVETIVGQHLNRVAVVQAASNDGNKKRHVAGAVPDNDTADVVFKMPTDSKSTLSVEIRYTGNHLDAAVKPPGRTFNAGDWQWISPGNHNDDLGYNGAGEVSLDNGDSETSVIMVAFSPPSGGSNVSGDWTLRLRNNTSSDTDIHGWCNEGLKFKSGDSAPIQVTSASTISPDASGKNVIVVGAYATEGSTNGKLAGFSSRGPALDTTATDEQNIRPHLSAPGVAITSAATDKYRDDSIWDTICCCDCCQDYYISLNGTSMATPHVVGAVALMFQKNNDLDWTQILDALKSSVRTDVPDDENDDDPLPNNNWGWGKLHVKDAVDAVPEPPGAPRIAAPPPGERPVAAVRFGGSSTDMLALRNEFFSLPKARFYQELVARHFHEVRDLINTNKRVATVWHRNGGPAIIRTGMQAAFQPDQPLPVEMDGISLTERLNRISEILKKYGSELLNRDIEAHVQDKMWILKEGFSIRQLLDLFKEQEVEVIYSH